MTASEPPGEHPPGDDTALLIATLNHAWAWYDAQISRALQVINYFLVATAVLATAYVSAINDKHYPLAAAVALTGIGLSAVTALIALRQRFAVESGGPVLSELQGRVAARLKIDMAGMIGSQTRTARISQSAYYPGVIALALPLLVYVGALLYAVIR